MTSSQTPPPTTGHTMPDDPPPGSHKTGDALNAQRFQMLEDIARELTGEPVFPTYFDAALRLRKELQDADLPTPRIARLIGAEPLIAAKLLSLANSVLYSPSGTPARNLSAAIDRLGIQLVRTTALTVALSQLMRSKEMTHFRDLSEALWKHSVKTAIAARVLAREHTRINPDEAMLAGLVHDLGAFYMFYRAAQYPELCARPETVKHLVLQWHEGIGVTLLGALGLPEEIVNASIDHDQPRAAPSTVRTLSDIVYVANVLAGTHFEWLYQDFDQDAGEPGLIRQNFADLLPEIEADASQMQNVFA